MTAEQRLKRLEKLMWISIAISILSLCATAFGQPPELLAAAVADYQAGQAAGIEFRYVWLPTGEGAPVVQFVAVFASRATLLDECQPVPMGNGLVRLNLSGLQWTVADWRAVFGNAANPLALSRNPIVVNAGLFVDRITDATRSDAYLRFVSGPLAAPKTQAEAFAMFGIDPAKSRAGAYGWVEGKSAVNVTPNAARLIRHDDGIGTESWITFDVRAPDGLDPLEELGPDIVHDASETFILRPLVSTQGLRGIMPVVFLADGKGKLVAEAPADIVIDDTRFGGIATIRTPGSCVVCHATGPKMPSLNGLADRLRAGVELIATGPRKTEIELFHLGQVQRDLDRWKDGYAESVAAINGLTAEANGAAIAAYVLDYRAEVTLERAALELACEPATLRLALADASRRKYAIGSRLAGLAHGIPMPRSSWESRFKTAKALINDWEKAQ